MNWREILARVLVAAMTVLAFVLGPVARAQSIPPTLSSARPSFSTTKINEEGQVGTWTCYKAGGTATSWPLKVKWLNFNTLSFRLPGPTDVYREIGKFDKTAEKVTGDHITMEAKMTSTGVIVWVDWQMNNEQRWNSRQIPLTFTLGCNGLTE